MKKTVLSLRKLGFVLVAATSMFAFSCGSADEATDITDAPATEEIIDEAGACEAGACEAGACEGGDSTDAHACEGGDHACEAGE